MAKPPKARLLVLGLGLALMIGAAACERNLAKESSVLATATAQFTFELTASPNILLVNELKRDTSLIKLVVKDGGVPVKDAVVYFTVVSGPAMFSDYTYRFAAGSNENGIAAATLLGPLWAEIGNYDTSVIVSAEVETTTPQSYYKEVSLKVLRAATK
jgi:hypothetical protein